MAFYTCLPVSVPRTCDQSYHRLLFTYSILWSSVSCHSDTHSSARSCLTTYRSCLKKPVFLTSFVCFMGFKIIEPRNLSGRAFQAGLEPGKPMDSLKDSLSSWTSKFLKISFGIDFIQNRTNYAVVNITLEISYLTKKGIFLTHVKSSAAKTTQLLLWFCSFNRRTFFSSAQE